VLFSENGPGLERIEGSVFRDDDLRRFFISAGVVSIDGSAFAGVSLQAISLSRGDSMFRRRFLKIVRAQQFVSVLVPVDHL
jgi:hypothetical protein